MRPDREALWAWLEAAPLPLEVPPPPAGRGLTHPLERPGEGGLGHRQAGLVILASGCLHFQETLSELPGLPPLRLAIRYLDDDRRGGCLGPGWRLPFETGLEPAFPLTHYQSLDGRRYGFRAGISLDGLAARLCTWPERHLQCLDSFAGHQICFDQGAYLAEFDLHGHALELRRGADGRPQRWFREDGWGFECQYAGSPRPWGIRDHGGRLWQLHYEAGRLSELITPDGAVRRYQYQDGRLQRVIDGDGETRLEVWRDRQGRVIRVCREGQSHRYHYGASYCSLSVTAPDGREVRYHLDECGLIDRIGYPEGHYLWHHWDPRTRTATTHAGVTCRYDALGRLIERVEPPDRRTTCRYPGRHPRPAVIEHPAGVVRHRYDARGLPLASTDVLGRTIRFTHDDRGRLIRVEWPGGERLTLEPGPSGQPRRLHYPGGGSTTLSWDVWGRPVALTAPDGTRTRLEWTPDGRLRQLTLPGGGRIHLGHDREGRLRTLTDPGGNTTRWQWTAGRVSARIRPDGRIRRYRWSGDGRLGACTLEDGSVIERHYRQGRLIRETHRPPRGPEHTLEYHRDRQGRLIEAGSLQCTYDPQGHLLSQRQDGVTVDSGHDAAGRLTFLRVFGRGLGYRRDAGGRLTAILTGDGQRITLHYDACGRLTACRYPNGLEERYHWEHGRLRRIRTGGRTLDYRHDAQGRICRAGGTGYRYDADGQLREAGGRVYDYDRAGNREAAHPPRAPALANRHDRGGRLLETASHRYAYDLRGRLCLRLHPASGTRLQYRYDHRDRLIAVDGHEPDGRPVLLRFRYDPLNRRSEKLDGGRRTRYFYYREHLAGLLIEEPGAPPRRVTLIPGERLDAPLGIENDQGRFYYHRDCRGSIIALSDARGRVVERMEYGPWGELLSHWRGGRTDNPYGYAGREMDRADLYYYRARYYDPTCGRFLSEDPLEIQAGDWHPYRHTWNDPVNHTDPLGLTGLVANLSRGVLGALATDLAVPDPSDLAWPKWLAWAAAGAVAGTVLWLTGEEEAPPRAEPLYDSLADDQPEGDDDCPAASAHLRKGRCAERLVKSHYRDQGYEAVDTGTLKNGSGHGLDHVFTRNGDTLVVETKSNQGGLSKLQRKGGKEYLRHQLEAMTRGVEEGEGTWKSFEGDPVFRNALADLEDTLEFSRTIGYRVCRVPVAEDPTHCYGENGKGHCRLRPGETIRCRDWPDPKPPS